MAGAGDVNNDGYDDFLVGAPEQGAPGCSDAGKVYLFYGSKAAGIRPLSSLALANASFIGESPYGYAGYAVAGAGDTNGDGYDDFLIGAYNASYEGTYVGKVYLLWGGPSETWGTNVNLSLANASFIGEAASDRFGIAVAGAGDVNHDGYADLVVGATRYSAGASQRGKTYLFYGNSTASGSLRQNVTAAAANASFVGIAASDHAGSAVCGLGDVNGDGYADIGIGANDNDDGGNNAGKAYIFYGNGTGNLTAGMSVGDANASITGEAAGDWLGYSLAGAGDVNRDGYGDILIGAYCNGETGSYAGKTYLFYGNTSGVLAKDMLASTCNASFLGEAEIDSAGFSVSGAGDVNGDKYSDFLIGAPGKAQMGAARGKIYLFFGNGTGNLTAGMSVGLANASFWGEAVADAAGGWVAAAGDVDNDGYCDLLIGAKGNDLGGNWAGAAYLILAPDTIAPGAISNLWTSNPGPSGGQLHWTAPGDDGTQGTVAGYVLKYSTSTITPENFDAASTYDTSGWPPYAANGTLEARSLTNLGENTHYYFAIKARDDWGNLGSISNVAEMTTLNIAPAAVTNLEANTAGSSSVTLNWTAPGDDGIAGTVAGYVVKYSQAPINAGNFDGATTYDTSGWGSFVAGGGTETRTLIGLAENVFFYFAIKARDEVGNYGSISNLVWCTTGSEAPGTILDLEVTSPTLSGFLLSWTAPGDDNQTGTVTGYTLKYSTQPITAGTFSAAPTYVQFWTQFAPAGGRETRPVTGLNDSTLYYFAIKAFDEIGNNGPISNMPSGYTTTDTQVPQVTSPADLSFVNGTTGHWITWTTTDATTKVPRYTIYKDSAAVLANKAWSPGVPVNFSVDDLPVGRYSITIVFTDGYGNSISDEVTVTVTSSETPPSTSNPSDVLGIPYLAEIVAFAALAAVLVLLVAFSRQSAALKALSRAVRDWKPAEAPAGRKGDASELLKLLPKGGSPPQPGDGK